MDVRVGLWRKLSAKELMFLNCGPGWWVPWTARRSKQSILKEISPEYSLEGLMLELKLQYFGHLMQRTDSSERPFCWERLKAGGEGDDRRWDGWTASPSWWTWVWVSSRSWWWTGRPGVLQSMGHKESDTTEPVSWTELRKATEERGEHAIYFKIIYVQNISIWKSLVPKKRSISIDGNTLL